MGRNWNTRELAGAGLFIAIGAMALVVGRSYPLGTVTRMGAGFFPIALGLLLVGVGVVLAITGRLAPPEPMGFRWKPFLMIPGGILIWALLVDRLGFFAATVPMVICCALVEQATTWKSMALLCLFLCLGGYLLFIEGIGVPISLTGK